MTKQELIEKYGKMIDERTQIVESQTIRLRKERNQFTFEVIKEEIQTAKTESNIYKSVLHDLGEMQ